LGADENGNGKGILPLSSAFSARGNGYLLACSSFSLSPQERNESVNKRHLTFLVNRGGL
jgi:hypothetical protein